MELSMRAFLPLLGLLYAGAAHAADLPPLHDTLTGAPALGRRIAPLVVYDYHPGVVVRAYWIAPWRHRHYYPVTGAPPVVGRDEDLSPAREPPEAADSYERHWSTTSAFLPDRVMPLPERPLK
jgi:hypothetical protein